MLLIQSQRVCSPPSADVRPEAERDLLRASRALDKANNRRAAPDWGLPSEVWRVFLSPPCGIIARRGMCMTAPTEQLQCIGDRLLLFHQKVRANGKAPQQW
eukprot:894439-Pyramimonas_sp.AAC.1